MSGGDVWTEELGFKNLATEDRERTLERIKELIYRLPDHHPEIFEEESISPEDYNREVKDAVFSLGGTLRQTHGSSNEETVEDLFLRPAEEEGLLVFTNQSGDERIDFKGRLDDQTTWALDVKGGEGQSIGHLLVPDNTERLAIWSERNARNTKDPSSRLNEVINRIVRWGLNQGQDVSVMIIRDPPAGARSEDGRVIPDVVVFPSEFPSPEVPDPEIPSLDELRFVEILFEVLVGKGDLGDPELQKHVWLHEMNLFEVDGKLQIQKNIYNLWNPDIVLPTQPIDYNRISEVE